MLQSRHEERDLVTVQFVLLAIWRAGLDRPARYMASWTWSVLLAIWRAGLGPSRHMASWTWSSHSSYGEVDEDATLLIFRRFLLWYFSEIILKKFVKRSNLRCWFWEVLFLTPTETISGDKISRLSYDN